MDSETCDELASIARQCIFTGVRDLNVGEAPEVDLGRGFCLVKPNEHLLSARSKFSMSEKEIADGATVSRYLVYKHEPPFRMKPYEEIKSIFLNGLMALQVLKPVRTLGFLFYGNWVPDGGFSLQTIERRPPMEPGPWALTREFDQELLNTALSMMVRIQYFTEGPNAENRNSLILLQLGLEHFHPLISGLLWTMGLEAVFDSNGKIDFSKKLCARLGSATKAFPDWSAHQPSYTVEDVAIHLYVLRSKVAHGIDLRKSVSDPKYPVDLLKKHTLPNLDAVEYALILSEAACYLLCQVLQQDIAKFAPAPLEA